VPTDPDLSEFESLTEIDELRRLVTDLQARLRRAKAKTNDLVRAAHDGAREATVILGNPSPVKTPARDKRQATAEAAVLHLSDWQLGKTTDSYDSDIARDRVRLLGEKLVQLVDIERSAHPVRECHNLLGGDLVEGTSIFPGQPFEIDSSLFRQVFNAVGAVEELVRLQLSVFETVHCWEVEGNHGRLGRKGDHPREDNADLFVYREARERLAEHEAAGRLVWHPRETWYQIVEIGNYRALLVHGDQIKQFGGNIPAFGIYRKVNGWASGVLPPFTDAYLGHFHQPLVIPLANGAGRSFVNPSLESDSAYAQEFVAATGTPGQRLNFVNPEAGRVTTERLVWLDR
jgi:hypothetical protein